MEQATAGIYSELIDQAARDTGFPGLKDKQKEAIMSFLRGNDIFVSLPTGFGKSVICSILPLVFDRIKGTKSTYLLVHCTDCDC